jgi:hypothetical protein
MIVKYRYLHWNKNVVFRKSLSYQYVNIREAKWNYFLYRFRIRAQTQDYYICYLLPLAMHSGLKSKSKRLVGSESELKWSNIANRLLFSNHWTLKRPRYIMALEIQALVEAETKMCLYFCIWTKFMSDHLIGHFSAVSCRDLEIYNRKLCHGQWSISQQPHRWCNG